MNLKAGDIIVSSHTNQDEYFGKSVILLVEVNDDGIIGFFLNRKFGRNLNELQEFSSQNVIPLLEGGPMDHEHLFFIHNQPAIGGDKIGTELFYSGNFKNALNCQTVNSNYRMKIFVGYCGWDREQILEEIKEGDWYVKQSPSVDIDIIFDDNNLETIWIQLADK
jgi:putative transcriptional regulator